MKKIFYLLAIAAVWSLMYSCSGIFDNIDDFASEGETVYPGRFDTIYGHVGYERVEIDLLKAGRISKDKIKLGKAVKTIVNYDGEDHVIDSLCSWVNITGLTEAKLYRFTIYSADEFDNRSVPVEIALIPFTKQDLDALVIASPRLSNSPTSAVVDWPTGITNVTLDYYGMEYSYTDKDGVKRNGERPADDYRFFCGNLQSGSTVNVDMKYKIVPKISRVPILDTVYMERTLTFNTATGSTPFSPSERAFLQANGVTTFTADGVANITKLVFPVHLTSINDVFYFSNLKELDLTGDAPLNLLVPATSYDNRGYTGSAGGGPWLPCMERVDDVNPGTPVINGVQSLMDLLEAGMLEKVRYIPGSLGLDTLLKPYVESGVVELYNYDDAPDEIILPHYLWVIGDVQDGNWHMEIEYMPTTYPAAPSGTELKEIYKATCIFPSSSYMFSLPREYRWDFDHYRYFKFLIYSPGANVLTGSLKNYADFWPRFMNYSWSFGSQSTHGQGYWSPGYQTIPDNKFATWYEIAVDMYNPADASYKYNRVIVMNFGGEKGIDPETGPEPMTFYVANARVCKNL